MRKKIALILAIMMVLTAVLTGCGGSKSDAKAPVKKAADGFMSALAAGEFDKLSAFCTEEAFESEDLAAVEAVDKLDSSLLEALGVTEDLLSEETKESITTFINTLKKEIVASYEIGEVEIDGDKALADGTVTFGFDTNMEQTSSKLMEGELNGVVETYMGDNQEALMKLYTDEGQDAMMGKMYNDLIPSILEKYLEAIRATEGGTSPFKFTLEKSGDAWLISDIDIKMGKVQESGSETEGK